MLKGYPRWAVVGAACVVAYLLQLIPITGIFLMLVGGPIAVSIGIHVMMILMAVESWRGLSPKPLLAIPILYYAIGPVLFLSDLQNANALSNELASRDKRTKLPFDPTRHAAIFEAGENALYQLQQRYELNALYVDSGVPGGDSLQEYVARSDCKHDYTPDFSMENAMTPDRRRINNACRVRRSAQPMLRPVTFQTQKEQTYWSGGEVEVTKRRATLDHISAEYSTAEMEVFFPITTIVAGCFLNSAEAKWQCEFHPLRLPMGVGASASRFGVIDSASIYASMLALKERKFVPSADGRSVSIVFPRTSAGTQP